MSRLFGLIGHPVAHSLSPPVMSGALSDLEIDGKYGLFDIAAESLDSELEVLLNKGLEGFNVTVPHKRETFARCNQLTDDARKVKAVNAVKVSKDGKLTGHNTDLGGFMRAVSDMMPPDLKKNYACVIGAGGAARAAVWGLICLGWWKIYVLARDREKARTLIDEVQAQIADCGDELSPRHFFAISTDLTDLRHIPDIVVNATTIGLEEKEAPEWAYDLLKMMNPTGVFFDMVYSPDGKPTSLVDIARKLRLTHCDGTEMLVHQAWLTLEFWTGKRASLDIMRQSLQKARSERLPLAVSGE